MAKQKLKMAKKRLRMFLNVNHIQTNSFVFTCPDKPKFEWSQETADHIKEQMDQWFKSWVDRDVAIVTETPKEYKIRMQRERRK